jgi:hypothetical protein
VKSVVSLRRIATTSVANAGDAVDSAAMDVGLVVVPTPDVTLVVVPTPDLAVAEQFDGQYAR